MARLMRAFFYRISKDITFKITLIVGAGMAVFMTLLYLILQSAIGDGVKMLSGQGMLISSFSPAQNFGIAIPINLISFTYLEFSQGSIRNKIIAGHSKAKIYASLFLSGLVFAFSLLLVYVGLCTALGSIFGGFDPNGMAVAGTASIGMIVSPAYLWKFVALALFSYLTIVSFTVFIATVFRNMGPSIPVVMLVIMGAYLLAMIISVLSSSMIEMAKEQYVEEAVAKLYEVAVQAQLAQGVAMEDVVVDTSALYKLVELPTVAQLAQRDETVKTFIDITNVLKVVDPFYGIAATETTSEGVGVIDNLTFFGGIASNTVYSTIFFLAGMNIFRKRDVK